MKFGFELFKIAYDQSEELDYVEKEIENLEKVWRLKDDWDKEWDEVKLVKFKDFEFDRLDDLADDY